MAPRAYWKGYLKLSLVSCPTGRAAIYSFGVIEYDDAFKKHHTANFKFMFGGDAGTRTIEREGIRLGAMAQQKKNIPKTGEFDGPRPAILTNA